MSNLIVLSFATAEGAQDVGDLLWEADKQGIVEIEDLAVVRRDDEGDPKMWQTVQPDGGARSIFSGAFWGATLGTLFVMPVAGLATGAAAGLHDDFGIDDDFIRQVRDHLQPNTSALCVLGVANDLDALRAQLGSVEFEITSTELDPEREAELRAMSSSGTRVPVWLRYLCST